MRGELSGESFLVGGFVFGTNSSLTRDGRDRLRVRGVLGAVLEHKPDGSLTHLRINLLRHDAILSTRKEAASSPAQFKHQTPDTE